MACHAGNGLQGRSHAVRAARPAVALIFPTAVVGYQGGKRNTDTLIITFAGCSDRTSGAQCCRRRRPRASKSEEQSPDPPAQPESGQGLKIDRTSTARRVDTTLTPGATSRWTTAALPLYAQGVICDETAC